LFGQSLEYAPMWEELPKLYPLEDQELAPGYPFSFLKPILDIAETSNTLDLFLNRLIDYIGKYLLAHPFATIGEGLKLWRNDNDARERLEKDAIKAPPAGKPTSRRPTPITADSLRPVWERDLLELSRIFVASGCYHLWPTCAFTFLLDKSKQ
jgi:hypothetical protein